MEYYVIRNERFSELAIYSFDKGERFEPDYLLFIKDKNDDKKNFEYQIYAEPKGENLLKEDSWKEEFLLQIEGRHRLPKDNYKIIGLPFYNSKKIDKLNEFEKITDRFLKDILK